MLFVTWSYLRFVLCSLKISRLQHIQGIETIVSTGWLSSVLDMSFLICSNYFKGTTLLLVRPDQLLLQAALLSSTYNEGRTDVLDIS